MAVRRVDMVGRSVVSMMMMMILILHNKGRVADGGIISQSVEQQKKHRQGRVVRSFSIMSTFGVAWFGFLRCLFVNLG